MKPHLIKTKEKDNYIQQLEAKLLPRGRPLAGQIDVTYRCNLACQHCFIVPEENTEELKFSQIISIIDQLYEAGCLFLYFSGGEPFLREDFLDIYTYARNKGFLVSIFTNGTLISEEILDYLVKLPPYSIEITLNGITQDVYEQITQVKGSFSKVMKAIELIKDKNLPLVLKCNGMKINYDQILKIEEFSQDLLGKKYFRCNLSLDPAMDGSKRPCALRLSPEETLNIVHSDEDMFSLCREEFLHHKDNSRLKDGYLFPCGLSYFNIDAYGKMRLCLFIREAYSDLKKEKFLRGFARIYENLSGLKFKTNSKCRNCNISYLCRQCPGRALAENVDMEAPVEFFCELAHKEAQRMEEVLVKK
ncbi:MAG: radical SAM protein [Candidatus Omnitrophica bacterium]|nr:radical SAM protein [Candidatus Omnitrophota bacterium]